MDIYQIITLILIAANVIAIPVAKALLGRLSTLENKQREFELQVAKEYATNVFLKEYVTTHFKSIEKQLDDLSRSIRLISSKN